MTRDNYVSENANRQTGKPVPPRIAIKNFLYNLTNNIFKIKNKINKNQYCNAGNADNNVLYRCTVGMIRKFFGKGQN